MKSMLAFEEAEIVSFFSDAATHALKVGGVEVIETHCARVFLAGNDAYKVKKWVKLPFLDFTTLENRFAACQREMDLNQPHAPSIYLGLRRISRSADRGVNWEDIGETIDWAIHMRRFDQAALLAQIADSGQLSFRLLQKLAAMVATYHRTSPPSPRTDGAARMRHLANELAAELSPGRSAFPKDEIYAFAALAREHLSRHAPRLDARAASGAVRRCHGDLHLGNIVLIDGDPVPFDALEFDEELATIDVLYDLAFLLMDLENRGLRFEANFVFNEYVAAAPLGSEIEGLACLPLFLSCRAAVRAIVSHERARQKGDTDSGPSIRQARTFLASSVRYLQSAPIIAIAIGGLSGSGKSTLGRALAPYLGLAPGAIHLRSDVERKRLAGIPQLERLPPNQYTVDATKAVYNHLNLRAETVVTSGYSVVTDAVFAHPDERRAIERATARAGAEFIGFWLTAPAAQLTARVEARTADASDATAEIVNAQLDFDLGEITWHRVDASGEPQMVLEAALSFLRAKGLDV